MMPLTVSVKINFIIDQHIVTHFALLYDQSVYSLRRT